MFKNLNFFSGFSVDSIQEARIFYRDTLGVDVQENPMGLLELHLDGSTRVIIYPKENHEPASFTVLNFLVENVEAAVGALVDKGVVMEQYDGELQTDEKGIMKGKGPDIAWFKDPAGNIISVIQQE